MQNLIWNSLSIIQGYWKSSIFQIPILLIVYFSRSSVMRNFRSSISGWMTRLSYSLSLILERGKKSSLPTNNRTMMCDLVGKWWPIFNSMYKHCVWCLLFFVSILWLDTNFYDPEKTLIFTFQNLSTNNLICESSR